MAPQAGLGSFFSTQAQYQNQLFAAQQQYLMSQMQNQLNGAFFDRTAISPVAQGVQPLKLKKSAVREWLDKRTDEVTAMGRKALG